MELKNIRLKKILKDLPVKIMGEKDLEVTGLTSHSKTVMPGNLFIAKGGKNYHGSDFVEEAIIGGARVILTDLYNPFCKNVTQVIHSNPKEVEALLASRFYHNPSKDIHLIGITGTNGKTTAAYICRQLLGESKSGLIGTVEYFLGKTSLVATHTTPDIVTNNKLIAAMRDNKLKHCVMEVTSHGIDQSRVQNLDFDIVVFTNLTQDHLDYHKTMEQYFLTKAKLFESLPSHKKAVINIDCPYGVKLVSKCTAKVITYGVNNKADLQAKNILLDTHGLRFDLHYQDQIFSMQTPLFGIFNLYNVLASIAVAIHSKVSLNDIAKRLKVIKAPPGRLQNIENSLGLKVFVDFAHTENALKNVLGELKKIPHKNIITVFGCGGDRDQDKRPKMGHIVSSLSDITIITSDNPRSENPEKICLDILKGCKKSNEVIIEPDRYYAIEKAISIAKDHDIILIAGRGHESHQLISYRRIPFSDASVVKKILDSH